MSEKRTYREFSAKQKTEIVLANLRGDRSVRDVCPEAGIAETLYYARRDKLLEQARAEIGAYDRYHQRPNSRLDYRTPEEVRQCQGAHAQDETRALRNQAA